MHQAVRRGAGSATPIRVWSATSFLAASAAVLVAGCSGDDVMATIGLPTSETSPAHGQAGAAPPGPPSHSSHSNALIVTPSQRAYLDALKAEGVTPSSDLLALSIGSYVCQARAAKQSDQAVWDYVVPMVRNDVRDDDFAAMAPSTAEVNAATADYIRIATDRLC
ncbi:DUF732 domain-containing protein [Mycobacterium deserti]|uniref:DUF732 domain-containing protein n=1 Tax=Mycobacterium deserti TaxID=2978347 RepID=A0ABT2MH71_9MYCO|nr:DUF732 domain-containing protein [Mycobacterium deserti]MCT7661582.1 DUF732 domain-containing protein [Mycobacterium deserti]